MDIKDRINNKLKEIKDERALQEMEQWLDALTGKEKEQFSEEDVRSAMRGSGHLPKHSEEEEQSRVLRNGPAKSGKRRQ